MQESKAREFDFSLEADGNRRLRSKSACLGRGYRMITEEGLSQRALGNPTINNWGEELAKSLGIGTKWESGVSGKQKGREGGSCAQLTDQGHTARA